MKLLCAMLAVAALAATTYVVADDAPACSVSLTLPDSAQTLVLEYRQVGPDLSAYREGDGLDETGLKALRLQSLFHQGGRLHTDVWLKLGDHALRPGTHPFGFTIGEHGSMHLFLVDGRDAVPLASEPLEPGFPSKRLALQWHYVDRGLARLVWHVGEAAGAVRVGLGTSEAPIAPPPPRDADKAPRDGR